METNWGSVKVSDVCELIVDCVNKTAPISEQVTPYKMIRTSHIKNGFIKLTDKKCVDESTYEKWTRRSKLKRGDVLLTREAPLGSVAMIRDEENHFLGQRIMQYRVDNNLMLPEFLLYSFLSPMLQHQFSSYGGTGSTVDHIRVPDCSNFIVPTPPILDQKVISHVLGTLDDKIELNQKMNQTLEDIAKAIFKSWFVDFDPVRAKMQGKPTGLPPEIDDLFPDELVDSEIGEIPRGWVVSSLGDLVIPKKGKSITKKTVVEGRVPVVAGGLSPAYYHNTSNVKAPVVTVSASGANAGFARLYNEDIWASDCSYISEEQTPFVFLWYVFLKIQQEKIYHMQQGAAQPHIYPSDLMRLQLAYPESDELWCHALDLISPMFLRIGNSEKETGVLSSLRDTLLPKLISGELRIPDAEKFLEEAGI